MAIDPGGGGGQPAAPNPPWPPEDMVDFGFDPSWGPTAGGGWQPSYGQNHPLGPREGFLEPYRGGFPGTPAAPSSAETPAQYGGSGGGGGGGGWGGWYGGGGGGGGGGGAEPTPMAPWEGPIPNENWLAQYGVGYENLLPWNQWEETPWANLPEENQQMAMAWFGQLLPWVQTANRQQQFDATQAYNQWAQQGNWANYLQQRALEGFGRRWAPSTRWM